MPLRNGGESADLVQLTFGVVGGGWGDACLCFSIASKVCWRYRRRRGAASLVAVLRCLGAIPGAARR